MSVISPPRHHRHVRAHLRPPAAIFTNALFPVALRLLSGTANPFPSSSPTRPPAPPPPESAPTRRTHLTRLVHLGPAAVVVVVASLVSRRRSGRAGPTTILLFSDKRTRLLLVATTGRAAGLCPRLPPPPACFACPSACSWSGPTLRRVFFVRGGLCCCCRCSRLLRSLPAAVPKCTAGPSVGRSAAVRRGQTQRHRPPRPPLRPRCRWRGSRPAVLPRLALLLPLLLLPAQAAALLLGPLVTLVV